MDQLESQSSRSIRVTRSSHRPNAFGWAGVDYAQIQKIYRSAPGVGYSPGECIGIVKEKIMGNPDPKHVSTSYVER